MKPLFYIFTRRGSNVGAISGPYPTKAEADQNYSGARRIAEQLNASLNNDIWGIAEVEDYDQPGWLQSLGFGLTFSNEDFYRAVKLTSVSRAASSVKTTQ